MHKSSNVVLDAVWGQNLVNIFPVLIKGQLVENYNILRPYRLLWLSFATKPG